MKITEFANKSLHNSAEELLNEFYELLPPELSGGSMGEISHLGIDALGAEIAAVIKNGGSMVLSFLLMLIGIVVLTGLASIPPGKLGAACGGGVSLLSSFAILLALYPLFAEAVGAISEMERFFTSLMPIILSYLALGGGVTTAATASVGMQFTIWIMGLIAEALGGIAVAMLAVSAVSSLGESGVTRIATGVRSAFTKLMGVLLAILGGMLALQTYISASADSATMRMAKHAAQNMIPVVGTAVSGALSTLGGGLSYAGSVIGGGAVASILVVSLSPIVMLLLYKLCLSLASLLVEFSGKGGGVWCFSAFSSTLDALISVYTVTTIIYILDIIVLIMGGEMIFGGA